MTAHETAKRNILKVALKLGPLRERAVFLGGSVVALLITHAAAPDTRPTDDVDVAIKTGSWAERANLDQQLRDLGFHHSREPGAPVCRWEADGCIVDVIPIGEGANAYSDKWSLPAVDHSELVMLEGIPVRHVSAPYFVAIKLETFSDRDEGNYRDSQDIGDIIQLLDGRPELALELRSSDNELRSFVADQFRSLLASERFLDSIAAHLPADAASQSREPIILGRMREIATGSGAT